MSVLQEVIEIAKKQASLQSEWNKTGIDSLMDQYHELTEKHDELFRQLTKTERREYIKEVG
jgi:hypothetical protein